jgi:predicted  nucleic acid-binding Zn-ribbon protein
MLPACPLMSGLISMVNGTKMFMKWSMEKETCNMPSTHDSLQVMTTEEILLKNVYDLQEQLTIANKRIVSLTDAVQDLNKKLKKIKYSIDGVSIYVNDVKGLLNEGEGIF